MLDGLYEQVVEIDERVILDRCDCETVQTWRPDYSSTTQEKVLIRQELDLVKVREQLTPLLHTGIQSVAIVFLHSYM